MKLIALQTSAFLLLDKPAGMTSHQAIGRLRKIFSQKKIGHSGTLDPAATGLLLIGLGQATRLFEYLDGMDKEYTTTGFLGATSTTDDSEGELTETSDLEPISREQLESALANFRGEIMQKPPSFSAVKIDGKTQLSTGAGWRET